MDLVLTPIVFTTICLYLGLIIFGNNTTVWLISFLTSIVVELIWVNRNWSLLKKEFFSIAKDKTNIVLIIVIAGAIFVTGFSASPFVVTKKINNFEHIQITDIGDYYKHTFVANMIAQDGIPPSNPYFPKSKLSYYYGYYLIPAFIIRVFNLPGYLVVYWYSLFSNAIVLLIPAYLIAKHIRNSWYKFLSILLIVTGVGVDSIPFAFNTFGQLQNDQGLQLINVYKSMLFVPQHFFAAGLTIWTLYTLLYKKVSSPLLAIYASATFLFSIFVSMTLSI